MAAGACRSGHSPSALNWIIDRVFEDAQHTGELDLCSRKLKDYPKIASKYDLSDTIHTDISKNHFTEIPSALCHYLSTECLICYHNAIRCLPEAIIQLQSLTHLNLSRNQLSTIPPFICHLQALEVLLASNNRLVSLPEEIGRLEKLMELDVSCNEITHLPVQISDLGALRVLNVRRNLLVELPAEMGRLSLTRLDFLGNKIQRIPTDYRFMETLEELILDHNPLLSPPAHICTKGLVHILKYLQTEAHKEDTKRGLMNNDTDLRRYRRPNSFRQSSAENYIYPPSQTDSLRRKNRHLVVSGDSGYNTTDDRNRWSPDVSLVDEAKGFIKGESSFSPDARSDGGVDNMSWDHEIPDMSLEDEFNRELARQQMKYQEHEQQRIRAEEQQRVRAEEQQAWREQQTQEEARRRAEEDRRRAELEEKRLEEMEREQRRRTSIKVQEEQKALLEKQRSGDVNSFVHPSAHTFNFIDSQDDHVIEEPKRSPGSSTSSEHYRDNSEFPQQQVGLASRRTTSDSKMSYSDTGRMVSREEFFRCMYGNRNGTAEQYHNAPSPTTPPYAQQRSPVTCVNPEEEFRQRHQNIRDTHRHEAQVAARRFEEEKQRIKQIQKSAVYNYVNKRTSSSSIHSVEGEEYSKVSSPTNPHYGDHQGRVPGFHMGSQKPYEQSQTPLNFTIRREMQHMREEVQMLNNLRENIESRLKVKLPDDLPGALKDGVVLCHLANHVRPRSISSIHVPSPAVPKLTLAKCRRNVENFLDACVKIGVDKVDLCSAADILEERALVRIASVVQALVDNGSYTKQSAV